MPKLHEIRADHDAETIVMYQAYAPAIAEPALAAQRFVAPFSVPEGYLAMNVRLQLSLPPLWLTRPGNRKARLGPARAPGPAAGRCIPQQPHETAPYPSARDPGSLAAEPSLTPALGGFSHHWRAGDAASKIATKLRSTENSAASAPYDACWSHDRWFILRDRAAVRRLDAPPTPPAQRFAIYTRERGGDEPCTTVDRELGLPYLLAHRNFAASTEGKDGH